MSVLDDLRSFETRVKDDVENVVSGHAAELEKLTTWAQAAESDPLVSTGLALVGFTPQMKAATGEWLAKIDAEIQRIAAEHAQAVSEAHAAGHAEGAAAAQPAEPAEPAAE